MITIKHILGIAGLSVSVLIITYVLSRVQVFAWLHGLNRFLNTKFKEDEQKENE